MCAGIDIDYGILKYLCVKEFYLARCLERYDLRMEFDGEMIALAFRSSI